MSESRLPVPQLDTALLTTVCAAGDDGRARILCFGNILELESDVLLLESKRELEIGAALILKVVFPGVQRGSKPVVSLGCMVVGVRDSVQLHYDLDIENMDDETSLQLAEFRSLRGFEKVG